MPLADDLEIGIILRNLGEPLIIECALNANTLNTFTEAPWGKILLSTYHQAINSEAYSFDVDAYQNVPVPPQDIVGIHVIQ